MACPPASMVPGGESLPSGSGGLAPFLGLWCRTRAGPLFLPLSQQPGSILALTRSCCAPLFWRECLSGNTGPWPQPWAC